jgi:hypothetical protein
VKAIGQRKLDLGQAAERFDVSDALTQEAGEIRLPQLLTAPTSTNDGAIVLNPPAPLDHQANLSFAMPRTTIPTYCRRQPAQLDKKSRAMTSPNVRDGQATCCDPEMLDPIFHVQIMIRRGPKATRCGRSNGYCQMTTARQKRTNRAKSTTTTRMVCLAERVGSGAICRRLLISFFAPTSGYFPTIRWEGVSANDPLQKLE